MADTPEAALRAIIERYDSLTFPPISFENVIDAARAALREQPATLTAPPPAQLTQAVSDVLSERRRQVEVEGWTPEHDDKHGGSAMPVAAACYAIAGAPPVRRHNEIIHALWPSTGWGRTWWKPKDTRRNLIRAAALILAEIERLDRAAPPPPTEPGEQA